MLPFESLPGDLNELIFKYCDNGTQYFLSQVCKFWLTNTFDMDDICYYCVKQGNKDLLIWIFDQGVKFPEEICTKAAKYNQKDIIIFCRTLGYEWDEDTCTNAAKYGHL